MYGDTTTVRIPLEKYDALLADSLALNSLRRRMAEERAESGSSGGRICIVVYESDLPVLYTHEQVNKWEPCT